MKKMTTSAMMQANGGASKTVKCPVCGYVRKNSLWDRLTRKDKNIINDLRVTHYTTRNMLKYGANNKTQAVHK